jgi:two-component system sensor histidine kinase SenX3
MEMKKEPFALRDVVGATFDRALPLAARKNIKMKLEAVPEAIVSGDRELMEYAVYNLLNNAIKYSPSGTEVTVGGEAASGHVHLAIRDRGIGMDEQDVRNIFKKFYRTSQAEASGEAGTGIGLSIVEQIVTHHGGRIDVTSAVGKGSCFTVILPIAVSAAVEKS